MSIRIFHTGDIHLAMNFGGYGDGVRESLVKARYESLEKMVAKSNELNVDIFVIAGDLFNSVQVAKRDINKTVQILNKFTGKCLLVLPGNHDYNDGVIDLWDSFMELANEKIVFLKDEKPYSLKDYGLDLTLYPAPCHNKHSKENSLGWIKENGLVDTSKYHIGIAHGALEGLSPDIEGNYYYMAMDELYSLPMDLWLLGHTHVRYPLEEEISNHKIFNAGTHEPDGLNFRHEGSAWLIDLQEEGNKAERIITGKYRFYDREVEIEGEDGLKDIEAWLLEGRPDRKITRISLRGSIDKDTYENLNSFYEKLQGEVFHLIIEDSQLKMRIDREMIEDEFTKGSFPYEFLSSLDHDEEAMQIAYDLLRRD